IPLPVCRFSRPVPSTTRTPVRDPVKRGQTWPGWPPQARLRYHPRGPRGLPGAPMLTRRSLLAGAAVATVGSRWRAPLAVAMPARPVPTPSQLQWQQDELALFVHFGMNTFTDREWGDGTEDPARFVPTSLDAHQWARTAKAAGARAMI